MALNKLITTLLLSFVGLMFIFNITPEIVGAVDSANLTGFTLVIATMLAWLIPVGVMMGICFAVFKMFKGGGRGGN